MKKLFLVVLVAIVYGASFSHAQDVIWNFTESDNVTFEWKYNFKAEPETAGFNIVCTDNTNIIQCRDAVGQVTKYVWVDFPLGYYYCFIVAYDKYNNSSEHSDIVGVGRKVSKQLPKPKAFKSS